MQIINNRGMLHCIQCKSSQFVNITQVIKNILSIILCYDAILTYSKMVCFLLQNEISMNKNCFTVYMHLLPNNKMYIGITGNKPEYRWGNGKGYKLQPYFSNAIQKYDWDNIQHIIIAEGLSQQQAEKLEIDMIKYWDTTNSKNGYNISAGGKGGGTGYIASKEERQAISNRMLLRWQDENFRKMMLNSHKPRNLTEETKKRLSQVNLGKEFSEETKRKISENMLLKWQDESYRERMSNAQKGKKLSEEHKRKIGKGCRKPILQFDLNMNFIREWDSATTAGKTLGLKRNAIYSCCNGYRKTGHGFIWKFDKGGKNERLQNL